jgi:hypothetical protein
LKFSALEQLDLYHTLVTEKIFEDLKAGLPACHIKWDAKSAAPNRRRS